MGLTIEQMRLIDPEPITIRYETDAMHQIRQVLAGLGHSHEDIDIFKACLVDLERHGLKLTGQLRP